jgi:HPt (histidine-containing phosphotransfer) domain-containing protein
MTAHAMQGDRERCLEAGMDDYITKPLQPRVLFSALNRWLQDESQEHEAGQEIEDYSSGSESISFAMDDGLFGETSDTPPDDKASALGQPEVVPPGGSTIDIETAIARFDDDGDFVMSIINEFRETLPEKLQEIRQSLQTRDSNTLCRQAHNLKGVSLNICAAPLAETALHLENAALRDELEFAEPLVTQLELESARLEEFLSNIN